MGYRELLELYRKGELEEEQRRAVEAEIEKQDAISGYLWERGEIPGLDPLPQPEELPDTEENDRLTAAIAKSIRRAFWKLGITVGAAVLAITLCILFVLPGAVDRCYYRPNAVAGQNPENPELTTDQLSLDLAVWTELFLPGRYRSSATAISRGYGVYDITIHQNSSPDGRFQDLGGQLVRNTLRLYDGNLLRRPVQNAFTLPEGKDSFSASVVVDEGTGERHTVSREEEREWAFTSLSQRPDNDLLIAYVSLDQIMDYGDFFAWYEGLDLDHSGVWAGIYTEDAHGHWTTTNTGVSLSPSGMCLDWDRERYPALSLLDNQDPAGPEVSDEAVMRTHFLSLLGYLDDHPALPKLFGIPNSVDTQAARAYVEEHGLQVYGLALVASRDQLMQLEHDPKVSAISVTPY